MARATDGCDCSGLNSGCQSLANLCRECEVKIAEHRESVSAKLEELNSEVISIKRDISDLKIRLDACASHCFVRNLIQDWPAPNVQVPHSESISAVVDKVSHCSLH